MNVKPNAYLKDSRKSSSHNMTTNTPPSNISHTPLSSSIHLDEIDFELLIKAMKSGLHICDRTWWFKTYKNCFIGSECITWLINNQNKICPTRDDALIICNCLVKNKYIRHVKNKHQFQDDFLFYIFEKDRKNIINIKNNDNNNNNNKDDRSYSLSNIINDNTNNNKPITATMGISSNKKQKSKRTHSRSVHSKKSIESKQNDEEQLAMSMPMESLNEMDDKSKSDGDDTNNAKNARFKFLSDKIAIGPLNDEEIQQIGNNKNKKNKQSSFVGMSLTKSAPIIDVNAKDIKFRNTDFYGLPQKKSSSKTATISSEELTIDGLTDDDEEHIFDECQSDDLLKYYYHQCYREYVPKIEYVHNINDNIEIALEKGTFSKCYSLPNYLMTNIYSMDIVNAPMSILRKSKNMNNDSYNNRNKMIFVASTGYRTNWIHNNKDNNDMYSAYIYAYFDNKWYTLSWSKLLNEYVSAQNRNQDFLLHPAVAINPNITSIGSFEIGEHTVLCVTWSYDTKMGFETLSNINLSIRSLDRNINPYNYYLSIFCWTHTDKKLKQYDDNEQAIFALFEDMTVIPLDFIPFCIHPVPLLFDESYVFIGGHDGVHCFECSNVMDTIQVIEIKDKMPVPEFKNMKNPVLSMDSHRFEGSDTMFIIVGCQDGFIQLSQKIKLKGLHWRTNRVFKKRINGPVSTLLFYIKPNIFDYYLINYDSQSLYEYSTKSSDDDENEESKQEYDLHSNNSSFFSDDVGDLEKELLNGLSLFIGSCSGYCMTYSTLYDNGFIDANSEYLNDHILYSIDCCDSILCSNYFIIKGYLYLLFGCYSGKLLCYQLNNISNDENDDKQKRVENMTDIEHFHHGLSSFTLVFESQFDQQIHSIQCINKNDDDININYKNITIMTINKIYFLSIKLLKHSLIINHTKIVSV